MVNTQGHVVPKSMAGGLTMSLLAILFGFSLGGIFGTVESSFKKILDDSGNAVLQTVYQGDVTAKDAVVERAWTYLKRAHLHGGAIGSAAVGCILVLVVLCPPGMLHNLSALALGLGAFLYPVFWLLAGLAAPGMGSTHAAKEAFLFVAFPGAGLCILGLCGVIFSVVRELWGSHEA